MSEVRCDFCKRSFQEIWEEHFSGRYIRVWRGLEEENLSFLRTGDRKIACKPCRVHICGRCASPLQLILESEWYGCGTWCPSCEHYEEDIVEMGFDYPTPRNQIPLGTIEGWRQVLQRRQQETILSREI